MIELNDQLGRKIHLDTPAKRIISLVPSQTELLHFYGLDQEVIGITKFCIHPEHWFRSKNRVGGTKTVDIEKVKSLNPDLIIANKEENTESDIRALEEIATVYISDVNSIDDALQMIKCVGVLVGKEQKAVDLIDDIQEDVASFPKFKGSVLYFIWQDPYMVCGQNNFINSILSTLGFTNVIKDDRYIEMSEEQIRQLKPDYIFLSTEPFPFSEKHKSKFKELCDTKILLVDGEMFSWYGSRMLQMKKYFQQLM